MFTASRIREYLDATPFRPLRVHLSDGSSHDVPHPEFAWLVGSRLYVAKVVKERGPDDPQVKELSVLHITRVEPLAKTKARK
jgi:hypothetical protein